MKHKKWRTRKTTYRKVFVVRGDIYYLGIRLCPRQRRNVCWGYYWKYICTFTEIEEEKHARTETEKYFIEAKRTMRDYKDRMEEMEKELQAAREGMWEILVKLREMQALWQPSFFPKGLDRISYQNFYKECLRLA